MLSSLVTRWGRGRTDSCLRLLSSRENLPDRTFAKDFCLSQLVVFLTFIELQPGVLPSMLHRTSHRTGSVTNCPKGRRFQGSKVLNEITHMMFSKQHLVSLKCLVTRKQDDCIFSLCMMYACMCVSGYVHRSACAVRRGNRAPGVTGARETLALHCGCWELTSGLPEEQ